MTERRWSRPKPARDEVFARELAVLMRKAREHRNLTQEGMAMRMDSQQENVSRIECSDALPSLRTLLRVADAADLTLEVSFLHVGHVRSR